MGTRSNLVGCFIIGAIASLLDQDLFERHRREARGSGHLEAVWNTEAMEQTVDSREATL